MSKFMKISLGSVVLLFLCIVLSIALSAQSEHYDGIDVSHHNGAIDWVEVAKDTNLQFVYIKATEGGTWQDSKYAKNLKGARENGLNVGSYHFFTMTASAQEQFDNFEKMVPKEQQDLVPMIDIECNKDKKGYHIGNNYSNIAEQRSAVVERVKELLNLIEKEYGCKPMIYCTTNSYNQFLKGQISDYKIYVGRYCTDCTNPGVAGYTIWQYSEKGHIQGIPKPCDLARFSSKHDVKDISMPKPTQK